MLAAPQVEREEVHRVADLHLQARAHMAVHKERTAPARVVAAHGDGVAGGIARIGHQRIGVQAAGAVVVHVDDDMGAAREGGQGVTAPRHEAEALDQRVDLGDLGHGDGNFRGADAHLNFSTMGGT